VSGIAIGKDGTIYVADQYNNRVSAYTRDGVRKWIRATGKPGNQTSPAETMISEATTAPAQMQLPAGITIDGAGRLVLVDAFGFQLVVLDATNGEFIGRYGDAGVEDGKFVYPSAIAYDSRLDYFAVADTSMQRVQLIRIPGSGGSALAGLNRTLLGPARACLVPLALLVLVIVGGLIYRLTRRRRLAEAEEGGGVEPAGVS
jgi:outer membrane protein assembly factor BamB